jgi:SapC
LHYERPIPLTGDILKQRIFSPIAYAGVRRANIIAIAASEVSRFAANFPIAWRRRGDVYELVILRSLLADGRGHAPGAQKALGLLPVLARAYPFLYDPAHAPQVAGRAKFVDAAIADEPSDIGAPICLIDGRPTKATAQRIGLLDAAAPSFAKAAAIARHLADADLFEAWPLRFDNVEGHDLEVGGLWIVKQDAVGTGAFAPLLRAHGVVAADLIGLHRLSLFRAGIMLALARAALKAATGTDPPPQREMKAAEAGADA